MGNRAETSRFLQIKAILDKEKPCVLPITCQREMPSFVERIRGRVRGGHSYIGKKTLQE